ncbi:hypothetical protein [Amycolatopsis sp. NBC_00438]|uniref:hypothetical protein n=1 Tax=Amycolatopsis sp. NBC_00438 TaxID=2903558 RepID=UPI002E1BDD2D
MNSTIIHPKPNHPCELLPAFPDVEPGDFAEFGDCREPWFTVNVYCPACLGFHYLMAWDDWNEVAYPATFTTDVLGTELVTNLPCIALAARARRHTWARVRIVPTTYREVREAAPVPGEVPNQRREIDPEHDRRILTGGPVLFNAGPAHIALAFTARVTPEIIALRAQASAFVDGVLT